MLGGEQGARLTRAAFSVILKFSDKIEVFTKLIESVAKLSQDIGTNQEGSTKVVAITAKLKELEDEVFIQMLKLWEQASQMRKWTQRIKLNLSERITAEIEKAVRQEVSEANPSKQPLTG